jgi:hypothetical protein
LSEGELRLHHRADMLLRDIQRQEADCTNRHERSNRLTHEVDRKLSALKDTVIAHDRKLVLLDGANGSLGRVGTLEETVAKISKDLKRLDGLAFKIIASATLGGAFASTAVYVLKSFNVI